ncbi:adhesion G protein-coupled receptor E1-like [Amblyraja radiata]|uniref:adhesion G protein-coupled receptor E1-like n=1 Tax=Amblyraja radiata TaxID=386614 RepID=UPI00140263F9|nr:adhesion G protein-coupled receptor E1-like [Amblyraja radiata]
MEPNLMEGCENENKLGLNSEVVTATVTNTGRSHLLGPVTLTFSNKKLNDKRAKCVFWNSSTFSWSTQGCQLVEFNATYTVCNCTHLTSFAVLMALDVIEGNDAHNLHLITLVGVIVSLVCLALSVLTFTLCRALKSIRTTIHTHLCISLFLAELLLIFGIDKTEYRTLCAVIAGFLHYFFLACFSWMLLEGVQLYLMLVKVFNAKSMRPTYMCLFGYGFPLITVGISAAVYSQGYGTEKYCWLDLKSGFLWAFLAPVCVIILVNGGFFIITVLKLAEKFSSVNPDMGQLKEIRVFTFTAVAQLCLLGCTWIFGMLHFQKETIVMAYIFTVINSMQGMFIFILHCLLNKQVRDEYDNFFHHFYRLKKDSKYSEFSTSSTRVNTVLFVMIIWKLRNIKTALNADVSTIKDSRIRTFKTMVQFVVLGCSWVIGLFQLNEDTIVLSCIFMVVNGSQGVFIFLVHCLLNQQVRREYSNWFSRMCLRKKAEVADIPSPIAMSDGECR